MDGPARLALTHGWPARLALTRGLELVLQAMHTLYEKGRASDSIHLGLRRRLACLYIVWTCPLRGVQMFYSTEPSGIGGGGGGGVIFMGLGHGLDLMKCVSSNQQLTGVSTMQTCRPL